jgi:hypothetical protein
MFNDIDMDDIITPGTSIPTTPTVTPPVTPPPTAVNLESSEVSEAPISPPPVLTGASLENKTDVQIKFISQLNEIRKVSYNEGYRKGLEDQVSERVAEEINRVGEEIYQRGFSVGRDVGYKE